MAAGQDWCLQCGAGAPGSLGTPGWRSAAHDPRRDRGRSSLGAAAAALRGAQQEPAQGPRVVTATVAAVPAPAAGDARRRRTTPLATPPTKVRRQTARDPARSGHAAEDPVDATTTPKPAATKRPPPRRRRARRRPRRRLRQRRKQANGDPARHERGARPTTPTTTPPSSFGDPSLAIDGDSSTGWTAQVEPATRPEDGRGAADRPQDRRRSSRRSKLVTSTPGHDRAGLRLRTAKTRARLDHRPGVGAR